MRPSVSSERGAILVQVLMLMTLVTAIAAGLAMIARVESMVSAHFRQRREAAAAAAAAVEVALQELRVVPDWTAVLDGSRPARFAAGSAGETRQLPGGPVTVCCGSGSLTDRLRIATGLPWTPFGWSTLAGLTGAGPDGTPFVVVWVADDEADGDGDPLTDGNATVRVFAQAIGPSGGRRAIEATIERGPAGAGGVYSPNPVEPPVTPGVAPTPFPRVLVWREW
jgi:hypothetical protein